MAKSKLVAANKTSPQRPVPDSTRYGIPLSAGMNTSKTHSWTDIWPKTAKLWKRRSYGSKPNNPKEERNKSVAVRSVEFADEHHHSR